MQFENSDQLHNHQQKYCATSDYANLQKLEEKYQNEIRAQKLQQDMFTPQNIQNGMNKRNAPPSALQNAGALSIADLQTVMQTQDDQFKKLERISQRQREDQMENELNALQEERSKIKLRQKEDEAVLGEILTELEKQKEKELRARIEKDQIRRALVDLQKAKLSTLGQEKKRELEKLINQREQLRLKEHQLVNDIQTLQGNSKQLDQLRRDQIQRLERATDGMKLNQNENQQINQAMLQDKSDQVAQLKLRREQLENERIRIMQNLDHIKNGDISNVKKGAGATNFGLISAKNILGDMREMGNYNVPAYRDQFRNQQDKIERMKNDNQNIGNKFMPLDADQIVYGGNQQKLSDNVALMYNNFNNNGPPQTYDQMQAFREATEKLARKINQGNTSNLNNSMMQNPNGMSFNNKGNNQISSYADNVLQDLAILQNDYTKAGGRDEKFLTNINNLEQFYRNAKNGRPNSGINSISPPTLILQPPPPIYQPTQQQQQSQPIYVQPPQNSNYQPPQIIYTQPNNYLTPNQLMMQNQPQQVHQQRDQGPFTLNHLHTTVNGYSEQENPYSIFRPDKEFFFQNEVRSVDMTEEERCLMSLQTQEVDAMRVINQVPVGTELYRFQMQQFKELSTTRAEVEKIVQEQRLQRLRRDFQRKRREEDRTWDNERWIDDQRKFIIAARIRQDMGGAITSEKQYDPNDGFIVHWDYILGLKKRSNYAQVVFGIFNRGETMYAPQLVDPHDCEVETPQTVRCIIGDSHQVFDIPPNPDTLMIIECQIPFSQRLDENVGRVETYGWTQMDIFDFQRGLRRGKWKCPLYYGPTDSAITVDQIQNLEPIPGAWIYFRIAYPNDEDFGRQRSLYPDHTMHEYSIPTIHLRNQVGVRPRVENSFQQPPQQIIEQLPNVTYYEPQPQYEPTPQQPEQYYEPLVRYIPEVEKPPTPPPPVTSNAWKDDGKNHGIKINVFSVTQHVSRSHMRVMAAVLEEGQLLTDDNGVSLAFNTSIHNPLDTHKRQKLSENTEIQLFSPNPQFVGMNNKAVGQDVRFQEFYLCLRNLPQLYNKNKKNIWLGIQLVEKPEPVELNDKVLVETSANYGGLEFEMIGWTFIKIIDESGYYIKKFQEPFPVYQPPIRQPPVDESKSSRMMETVKLSLSDYIYDVGDLDKMRIDPQTNDLKERRAKVGSQGRQNDDEKKLVEDASAPFFENLKSQFTNKPFEKKQGVDFYIDALRFLPDKVTATKILIEAYNRKSQQIFQRESTLPIDLNTDKFNPEFQYRREFRQEFIDPTTFILMTILTIDKATNNVRIVGYSAVQLFINQYEKKQPQNSNDSDYVLYDGCYQLPIFSQQLDRTPPFHIERIYGSQRLPTASILVRIYQAPLSEDGLRSLSISEFPNQPKEWQKKGLYHEKPKYGHQVYNTENIDMTKSEKTLLISRFHRGQDVTCKDETLIILKSKGITKNLEEEKMKEFLDKELILTSNTFMIDMMYFAKYDNEAGVMFNMDGIHNVPDQKLMYFTMFSTNPPGTFYTEEPDVRQVNLVSRYNWKQNVSAVGTFQFEEPFRSFQQFKEDTTRYISMIVDVKSVNVAGDFSIKDVGWTVVPLFQADGYVLSGIFQMPLIKGAVQPNLLEEMQKRDAWDIIRERVALPKSAVQYLEFTSVMVRVLDAQRDGHFKKPFDTSRLDYRYLPEDTIQKWAYNQAVELKLKDTQRLQTLIPSKESENSIQTKITNKAVETYALQLPDF